MVRGLPKRMPSMSFKYKEGMGGDVRHRKSHRAQATRSRARWREGGREGGSWWRSSCRPLVWEAMSGSRCMKRAQSRRPFRRESCSREGGEEEGEDDGCCCDSPEWLTHSLPPSLPPQASHVSSGGGDGAERKDKGRRRLLSQARTLARCCLEIGVKEGRGFRRLLLLMLLLERVLVLVVLRGCSGAARL